MELLIGAGHRREKLFGSTTEWKELITLDNNSLCKPDVLHNLDVLPYPFRDNQFDEIHAYEVLEHCGRQGDYKYFFAQWDEFYRILKPDGIFAGTVPSRDSRWLWGDPSHTRSIQRESLIFLDRRFYNDIGKTPMSDFRSVYNGDFQLVHDEVQGDIYCFVLKVIKNG